MNRLKDSEWLPYAPEDTGTTIRINHSSYNCNGTSNSLRITKSDDGVLTAKCYRCGGWGRKAEGIAKFSNTNKALHTKTKVKSKEVYLPSDLTTDFSKWPVKVAAKVNGYGITQHLSTLFGIGWSEKYSRLILPVYKHSTLVGWQGRGYDEDKPKYITRYKDESDLYLILPNTSSNTVVVCEDMFSAIRCSKYANAVALLGTNIGDKLLAELTEMENIKDGLVFLDMDNKTVIQKAYQMQKLLTSVGIGAKVITEVKGTDPKELSDLTLSSLITPSP